METLPLSVAACAGGRALQPVRLQAVGGSLSGLAPLISDENAH